MTALNVTHGHKRVPIKFTLHITPRWKTVGIFVSAINHGLKKWEKMKICSFKFTIKFYDNHIRILILFSLFAKQLNQE